MKKILSMLLSATLICSFVCPAFAASRTDKQMSPMNEKYRTAVYEQIALSTDTASAERAEISISSGMYLYSFDEKPVAIFYNLAPQGYAILDYENSIVLECSTEANNPFFVDKNARYYYNGVFNYYIETKDGLFTNLATNQTVTQDTCQINEAKDFYSNGEIPVTTKNATSEGPVYLSHSTRLYNCNVSDNFSFFYPDFTNQQLESVPGICGSLACAVVVAYLDDYKSELAGDGDFATDWKKSGGSASDNTYGKYLVKEFVGYVEPSGNGSFFLNPGMSSYLSAHNISGGCSLGLLSVYIQTKNSILPDGSGNPVIIGLSNHYCVGAGYKNISAKQIYVNTGWGYNSWINASTVVSTWTMFFN